MSKHTPDEHLTLPDPADDSYEANRIRARIHRYRRNNPRWDFWAIASLALHVIVMLATFAVLNHFWPF